MKVFWLIIAILTAIWAVYAWFTDGIENAWPIFIMTGLSLLFFLVRRTQAQRDN